MVWKIRELSPFFYTNNSEYARFYRSYIVKILPKSIRVKCQQVGHSGEWGQKKRDLQRNIYILVIKKSTWYKWGEVNLKIRKEIRGWQKLADVKAR